jgi:phosphatidylserine decarboxylase
MRYIMSRNIQRAQPNHMLIVSVYDSESLGRNVRIARASVRLAVFLGQLGSEQRLALPLETAVPDSGALVLLKATYLPMPLVRRRFWKLLCKPYIVNERNPEEELSVSEAKLIHKDVLSIILDSVGCDLDDAALHTRLTVVNGSFYRMDDLIDAMEQFTLHPLKGSNDIMPDNDDSDVGGKVVRLSKCPLCGKVWSVHATDLDVVTHLGECVLLSNDNDNDDDDYGKRHESVGQTLMMGGFLTEECASRKWFMRLFAYMSFGPYNIGRNNGNIFVQDRYTGKLKEERIPTYIRLGLRLLHQNIMRTQPNMSIGLGIAPTLFQALSIRQGIKFDAPQSAKHIPEFVRYHRLNTDDILKPLQEFASFNDFFYRQLKPSSRPISGKDDPSVLVSPCDCRLNVFPTADEARRLWIKGRRFSISQLVNRSPNDTSHDSYAIVLCRLAPQDYHRFHCPLDDVTLVEEVRVPGQYFTVNPMAVRQHIDVLTENVRVVYVLRHSKRSVNVYMVAVGAMMVGSVVSTCTTGSLLRKGQEMGYFAFGGSTIVLCLPSSLGDVAFSGDLLRNSQEQLETYVHMGDGIGVIKVQEEATG